MKLFSFKYILLRYFCVTALITAAGLLANPRSIFVVIPVAILSLKFILYDVLAAAIKAKFTQFRIEPWLLAGYIVAVTADMLYTHQANLAEPDAGIAFLAEILVTPWVLAAALAMMLIAAVLTRKKQAKP